MNFTIKSSIKLYHILICCVFKLILLLFVPSMHFVFLFWLYLCCLIFITFHFIYGIKLLDGERQESYLQLLFLLQSRCTLCNAEIETGSLIPNHGIFHFLHSLTLFHPSTQYTQIHSLIISFWCIWFVVFLFIYFSDIN